jgi:hypothetical protein
MNIYERAVLTLTAASVLSLTATSCDRTRINRLEGEWEYVGGDLYDANADGNVTWEFQEDGDVRICFDYATYNYCDTDYDWDWDGNLDSDLELSTGSYSVDVEIKELTSTRLEFETAGYDAEFEKK